MRYMSFNSPNKNLEVSRIAIGSAMSMERLSKKEYYGIYDLYLEQGGNCIDTARSYNKGTSEALLGEYLKSRGNREQCVISTKGCDFERDGSSRLSKANLEKDLDESLKALGTDIIDFYWVHKDDRIYPVEDVIDQLNEEVKKGKIAVFGCSNWKIDRIAQANEYAQATGQMGFAASQVQWSLATTEQKYFEKFTSVVMNSESYHWYNEQHLPIFSFSSQAQGFFPRVAAYGLGSLEENMREAYGTPENLRRLEAVKKYVEEKNVSWAATALAFLLNNQLPCIPIIGAETKEMLLDSLSSLNLKMTEAESDALYQSGFAL